MNHFEREKERVKREAKPRQGAGGYTSLFGLRVKRKWMWIGVAVFIVIGFSLPRLFPGEAARKREAARELREETAERKREAWAIARQFVEDRLVSPGTADYGSVWKGTHQSAQDAVTIVEGEHGGYQVCGWVDSQNALGATVRTHFVAWLKPTSGEKWKLISLDMEQQGMPGSHRHWGEEDW